MHEETVLERILIIAQRIARLPNRGTVGPSEVEEALEVIENHLLVEEQKQEVIS